MSCNAHTLECASIRDKLERTPSSLRFTVAYYRSQPLPLIYPFHFALTSPPVLYVPHWSTASVLFRVFNEEHRKPAYYTDVGLQLVGLSRPLEDNVYTWARKAGRAVAALDRQPGGTSGTVGGNTRLGWGSMVEYQQSRLVRWG